MVRPAEVVKDLITFKRLQKNSNLSAEQIKLWTRIESKYASKLWNWKLSVTSKDAIDKGMKGKQISDYMKEKEEELFISS